MALLRRMLQRVHARRLRARGFRRATSAARPRSNSASWRFRSSPCSPRSSKRPTSSSPDRSSTPRCRTPPRFIRTGQVQARRLRPAREFRPSDLRRALRPLRLHQAAGSTSTTVTRQVHRHRAITSPLATTCNRRPAATGRYRRRTTPGDGSDIILVRVYYKWPTLVNLGGFNLAEHRSQLAPAGLGPRVPQRAVRRFVR